MSIGGGGKGALPTGDVLEAVDWIERHDGWGNFVAAELLTGSHHNVDVNLARWRASGRADQTPP